MKKILIFGGSGLLGSHCVKYFRKSYIVKWTYSELIYENADAIHYRYSRDKSIIVEIIRTFKPDIIINAMGLVSVEDCEQNIDLAYELNSNFVSIIVSSLHQLDRKNTFFIQISSGGVYGNPIKNEVIPWEENANLNPLSIYAKSKVMGEKEALKYEGPHLIVRSDFYGLNKIRSKRTLLSWIIDDAKNNIQMEGWENIYFSPISASKLCETIDELCKVKCEGVFNISSEFGCNKFEFVETVCNELFLKPDLHKNTIKSIIRPKNSILSCKKLKKEINFQCDWKLDLKLYLNKNYVK